MVRSIYSQSMSPTMFNTITSNLGTVYPSRPNVFPEVISITQQLDTMGIRELINRLIALKLEKQPAKNIEDFNQKVRTISIKLDNCNKTSDLSALVARCYIDTTLDTFKIEVLQVFNACNRNPRIKKWEKILNDHVALYRSLKRMNS